MSIDPNDPEFESIETFVEFCIDDERSEFSHEDLQALCFRTQSSSCKVRAELESFGLVLAKRQPERRVRGVRTSSHDRYYGPGACKTHGGSGWEQINGFAGRS